MDRKILFFDIDGTLLDGGINGSIPESAIQALTKAQQNGHLLFINTGRTFCYLPQQVRDFPFDGYVCGCGTSIILHGKEVFHNEIPKSVRFGMRDIFQRCRVQGVLEGRKAVFYNTAEEMLPPIAAIYDSSKYIGADIIRTFDDPELDYDKFVIFAGEQSDLSLFRELTASRFEIIQREEDSVYQFAEIVPKHCSKASGIDFITEYLDTPLNDCFVFGDSMNDLPMLLHVKNSIAMGNSYPGILDRTSYVTTPINRDGIMVALKYFGLI